LTTSKLNIVACVALATCSQWTGVSNADEPDRVTSNVEESAVLFVRHVRSMLKEKCYGCHGDDPADIEGDLDVGSLSALLAGGSSGEPAINPGDAANSPMYLASACQSDEWSAMPPKESEQLSEQQLKWLAQWIDTGAIWPSDEQRQEIETKYHDVWSSEDGTIVATSGGLDGVWTNRRYDPAGLWAYQPIEKPDLNQSIDSPTGHPIDRLLESALPDGLTVAPRADRRTLIRRATFDLTGFPPSPEDVQRFLDDSRSEGEAFAVVIERLLASRHYGERMAQHWLDVSRYADSSGFANDYERGNAWRYRDYVVRAFNNDKPYDEFVREQIAGDEIDPDNVEAVIATGFLRMGPWELTGMEVAKVARQRFLDDVTNSIGETFLAHSLQCASCHDHKFDPVPTRDYYSIQAVFATTQLAERRLPFESCENTNGFAEKTYLQRTKATHQAVIIELDEVLIANAVTWFDDHRSDKEMAIRVEKNWNELVIKLQAESGVGKVFKAARNAMKKAGFDEGQYPPKSVGFSPTDFGRERVARKGLERLRWEFERYEPYALGVYNGLTPKRRSVNAPTRVPKNRTTDGELEQSAILTGGDPFSPGQAVTPDTLSVIDSQVATDIPDSIEGRREAFARWVTDANNPLTPRVIVNRVWQWHFGKAIAGNPNNFGSTGKRPTHPRLLDWLAASLMEGGWSIKDLHRKIMTSDAYSRSTFHPDAKQLAELDPELSSYAVFKPRRLSAEEIRDAMLVVTDEMNPTLGGIPCRPIINEEVALQPRQVMGTFASAWTPNPLPPQRNRRSLYVLRLRGLVAPLFDVFNTPSPDFSCEQREASTVTPQVFSLFNGQTTHTRSLALAVRMVNESSSDEEAIRYGFELVYSRTPTLEETNELLAHWRLVEEALPRSARETIAPPHEVIRKAVEENTGEQFRFVENLYSNHDFVADRQPADVDPHVRALAEICLVMLNSNEFVYVY